MGKEEDISLPLSLIHKHGPTNKGSRYSLHMLSYLPFERAYQVGKNKHTPSFFFLKSFHSVAKRAHQPCHVRLPSSIISAPN
jgi:hypothetical protein